MLRHNFMMDPKCCQGFTEVRPRAIALKGPNESTLYMVEYNFLISRKTRKRGSWSTLERSWARFSSMMTVYVPLTVQNPWRT